MQNDVNKIVPSCFIKWQDRTGTYRCYVTIAFWRHLNNFVEKKPSKNAVHYGQSSVHE